MKRLLALFLVAAPLCGLAFESIIECTYDASERESEEQAREQAMVKAYRMFLEELGTYVVSVFSDVKVETTSRIRSLTKSQVLAVAGGFVRAKQLPTRGPAWSANRYTLRVRLKVDEREEKALIEKVAAAAGERDGDTNGPAPPRKKPSWLRRNWGWCAGGAAVAGGGTVALLAGGGNGDGETEAAPSILGTWSDSLSSHTFHADGPVTSRQNTMDLTATGTYTRNDANADWTVTWSNGGWTRYSGTLSGTSITASWHSNDGSSGTTTFVRES